MIYPHGVYAATHLSPDTEDQIKNYCKENMPNCKMNDDLHSTLAFSKKPYDKKIKRENFKGEGKFKKFSKFGDEGKILVIELESEDLKNHNKKLMSEHGLISDYDEYRPHITLSDEGEDIDENSLPSLNIIFKFNNDFIEDIDEDENEDDSNKESNEEDTNENNIEEEGDKGSIGFTM